MPGSQGDENRRILPVPERDLGYPEGSSPEDALASILSFARDIVRGDEVLLLVPRDRMPPFTLEHRVSDETVSIAPGVTLSCSREMAEELLDNAPDASPYLTQDESRLIVTTPTGALVVVGPTLHEASDEHIIGVMQLLSVYAASSVAWASQLLDAERRAAEGEEIQHTLRLECARLRELSEIDELTGLYNRRFFKRHLDREVRRFQRYSHPLSLALIDVDRFKDVNDSYGHAAGDEALCHLAKMAVSTLRESDLIARVGGDEFAVLMPDTPTSGGVRAAERLLSAVAASPLLIHDVTQPISLSIGVAGIEERGAADPVSLFKSADAALYLAKQRGRGRVVGARPPIQPG